MTGNNRFITREERLEAIQRYLEQGLVLTDQIRSAEMQWQVLTGRAFSLSSPGDLSAERVQTSPSPEASFADPLESRSELEEKLAHLIRSLRSLREQMIRIINHDTIGNENLILTCRYVRGMQYAEIAKEVNYCPRQVKRICEKGMGRIVLPEDAIWIDEIKGS